MADQEKAKETSKNQLEWVWPSINDLEAAQSASYSGAASAMVVAVITLLVMIYNLASGSNLLGIDLWVLFDISLYCCLAAALYWYKSRVAAILLLTTFIAGKIYMFAQFPKLSTGGVVFAIILLIGFVSGVRGAFAFHKIRKSNPNAPLPEGVHVRVIGTPMKVTLIIILSLLGLFVSLAIVGLMLGEA
mgnify:CR=1 FL=1